MLNIPAKHQANWVIFVTVSIALFPWASTLATWSKKKKKFLLTFFIANLKGLFTAKMKFIAK